ncbi:NUDIX domain-containing protein [Microbacterium sp. 2MCAF23]|uniref:NUDIX domain-containing protein n=1 Tax=Microbacterium sp. 2MCAF23 TaxID=3232985 RepID=UPI003F97E96E
MRHDDLIHDLAALRSSAVRDSFHAFVRGGGDTALRRDGGAEHVTGSCFVFSPDFTQVLLCFHGKGQFWVQFGGHIEPGDPSIAAAARREAREESGISDLALLSTGIIDLDRHDLNGGFACSAHWDIGFAALADPTTSLTAVSEESEDVRWFPVGALPAEIPDGFAKRLAAARVAAMQISVV